MLYQKIILKEYTKDGEKKFAFIYSIGYGIAIPDSISHVGNSKSYMYIWQNCIQPHQKAILLSCLKSRQYK